MVWTWAYCLYYALKEERSFWSGTVECLCLCHLQILTASLEDKKEAMPVQDGLMTHLAGLISANVWASCAQMPGK
jgi:hypothetical protein